MSFLAPLTLIGLALLALPVLIHLLVRRRARRLDFPTLRFLRETPSFRLYPRHVREPVLLMLRLAALLLLILGLARPFISLNARSRPIRVILIDASLSMGARGRAEAAREQARSIIDKLSADERAAIIAFSSDASVLAEATGNRDQLIEALKSYEPTGGETVYIAGLEKAASLLRQEAAAGTAEIDLISDFQESNLTAKASELSKHEEDTGARIVTYAVGTQIERNAFLTDVALSRGARGLELSATEIVSDREGQSASRRNWTLDAVGQGMRPDVQWRTQESNGQIVGAARANAPDDFDVDDNFYFAFAQPREHRALLIETEEGGASLYLRAALEAATAEEDDRSAALERRRELPDNASELASYSLVALELRGAPRAQEVRVLSEYVNAGGYLWLWCARDLDAESLNALVRTPEGAMLPLISLSRMTPNQPLGFGAMDVDAPALGAMNDGAISALRAVRMRDGYAVTPRENAYVLVRWSDAAPALVSASFGAGSVLLMATSVERAAGDLGLSPSLPALAYSILRAAEDQTEPPSRFLGEPISLGVHPDTEVTVKEEEGNSTRAATTTTTSTTARTLAQHPLGVFREPGIYHIEFAGQSRTLALNAPAAESARTLASPEEIKNYFKEKEDVRVSGASDWRDHAERRGNLWRIILCAAFILLVAELFVSIRRARKGETLSDVQLGPTVERA